MGMTGFMAASLNAPLAALLAIVELSGQLEIIVPAMFVITISSIISGQIFKNRSIFTMQLDVQGLKYRTPPIEKALQSIGVSALMKKDYKIIEHINNNEILTNSFTQNKYNKLIIKEKKKDFQEGELENITNCQFSLIQLNEGIKTVNFDDKDIQLLLLEVISEQATLAQAYSTMMKQQCSALVVYSPQKCVSGIIYQKDITTYLERGKLVK
jgi:hypothetical protein